MEQLPSAAIAAMAAKTRRVPERPPFDRIALLLQGGGALGSYQAGVYAALAQAERHTASHAAIGDPACQTEQNSKVGNAWSDNGADRDQQQHSRDRKLQVSQAHYQGFDRTAKVSSNETEEYADDQANGDRPKPDQRGNLSGKR